LRTETDAALKAKADAELSLENERRNHGSEVLNLKESIEKE
jgi:hypothetical protein